jgi:hypothetical protein
MANRGRPKNPPAHKDMLKNIMPLGDIFEEDELETYNSLVDVYLADFDPDDMSSGDMDDIMSLAMNRVLEIRLLKSSKGNVDMQLDIAGAVEKIRKQNDKLRENLSSRRKDRINPNEYKGFSIVDLAVAFDEEKKTKLNEKVNKLKTEEAIIRENRSGYVGNRYDRDDEVGVVDDGS